jgi:PAS domain S-box-containing protein
MAVKPTYTELEQEIETLKKDLKRSKSVEQELNNFFELSPDMIGSGNLEGFFTNVNDAFKRTLGYSASEIYQKPFTEFIHEDDVDKTKAAIADAAHGKRNIYIENRYKCKDGAYKSIDWSVLALAQENRFLAIGRDISDRKRVELALRESEGHLRSLKQSASNFAIYRLARDTSKPFKLKVVFVSASAKNILSIEDPLKFETWFENMHPDDVKRVTKANQDAFYTMKFDEEYRTYNRKLDEYRWLHAVSTGTADKTGWTGFVNGILIDVTDKHKFREALDHKTKSLIEMNTALNALIKNMESKESVFQEQITANIQHLVLPYLQKMRTQTLESTRNSLIDIVEANLKKIYAEFTHQLSSSLYSLTATEIKVANLVKLGNTTKEIASILGISYKTVESHRERIRKKLGISNQKINLRSYLLSMS